MRHQHVHRRGWRRALMTFLMLSGFILLPLTGAQANPMCPGNPAPLPESAGVVQMVFWSRRSPVPPLRVLLTGCRRTPVCTASTELLVNSGT